jgi:signal transduction histidine kinase/ligand-binding sensor domain-containing protein
MRSPRLIAAAWFALVLANRSATALDPNTRITQYRHNAWRVQEGAFESAPNAITQTADGYLWIGTDSGLVKYDGVRFLPWASPPGTSASISAIYSLRGSSDGTLWIGDATGLLSWKDGTLQKHVGGRINSILEDRKGRIWVARSRPPDLSGGLCQVVGERPRCIGGDDRMRLPYAALLSEDRHGNLWIGSANQLMEWNDGSFETFFRKELQPFQGLSSVTSTVTFPDGSVWAAIPRKGLGVFQIVDGIPRKLVLQGISTEQINSLFVDRDGSVWMGTHGDGVYRKHGQSVDHFRSEDGLSSNDVRDFYQDREGNLWLITSKGLDCFRDNRLVTISRTEGLAADLASSVLSSDDGNVWIGNRGSLDLFHADHVTSIQIPGLRVTSLWQDHAKRLWVGVDNLLMVYENGRFQQINRRDGSPLGTAVAITEDREQNIWVSAVGNDRKLFRIRELRVQEDFTPDQIPTARLLAADPTGGIWLGLGKSTLGHYRAGKLETFPLQRSDYVPFGLTVDADGSAWASTPNGIVHWKNREIKTLTTNNGLPCDTAFSAVRDNHATLWIYAKCGLIAIADSELERWWQQPDRTIQSQLFDVFDGALPGRATFQPAVSKSPDGRLWFVNDAVLQVIDPDHVQRNSIAPPVYVEGVRADRRDYALSRLVRLPAHSRDIEIGYTALSYSIPQKVLFRCRLDGRDHDWQDAGTRRQAFYSDLPPGQYRFHVTASNNDGVWNEAGALLDFSIDPAYYQTRWFQAACIAVLLAAIWGLYRYRLHQIAHEFNVRLEERVGERTRVARELHDTLLQNFHGVLPRLQAVYKLLPGRVSEAKEILNTTIDDAAQAITEARDAVQNLRSSTVVTNDLAKAVQTLGEDLAAHQTAANGNAATFAVEVEGAPQDLHPILRDEIYRITAEAVRNAFNHARARRIEVEIRYSAQDVRVRVRDDGAGIEPNVLGQEGREGHFGLAGMRERAEHIRGKLEVWSERGAGTEVELTLPASVAYAHKPGRRSIFTRNAFTRR